MSVPTTAERHVVAMKYEYARLALSSPARFEETLRRDPAYFVDLWRARADGHDLGAPTVFCHEHVAVLGFPSGSACRFVVMRLHVERARVFFLEVPHPQYRARPDQAVLVEVTALGRAHHGLIVVSDAPTLAQQIALAPP